MENQTKKNLLDSKSAPDDLDNRMSVAEVARYFNTTRVTVYRWLRTGLLPCRRTPSGYVAYIPRNAVEQFQVR